MASEKSPVCICNECGELFREEDLAEITFREYPGARPWTEDVSPCCNAYWDYGSEV